MMTKRLSTKTFSMAAILTTAAFAGACSGGKGGATAAKDPSAVGGAGQQTAAGAGGPSCNLPNSAPSSQQSSAIGTQPIGASGAGGALVLARTNGRRVAFVADEDAKAVLTIDADTRQQIAETKVGGTPSQVFVARDGRVLVTVRDANKLVAMRVDKADAPLTSICETKTPAEPIAIAVTPDERTVVVTSGWGQKLSAFDAVSLSAKFETKLPREPRGVVVSDDGKTAFVSHAVGSIMSGVDLAGSKHASFAMAMRGKNPQASAQIAAARRMAELTKKSNPSGATVQFAAVAALEKRAIEGRQSCQGFVLAKSTSTPNRIFAPQVMVDAGDPEKRPSGYGDSASIPEVPAVAVIDEAAAEPLASSMVAMRGGFQNFSMHVPNGAAAHVGECLLPRAAAIDPQTKSLLVTCVGIDAVISYDAMSGTPSTATRKHWNVGAGPTGIAIDPEKRQALVFSQFDRTISTLPLGGGDENLVDDKGGPPAVEKTALAPLKEGGVSAQFMIGRMLFHASGDIRISSDGRACASCHPDGRDDAITWATPEGPRRSIMLAGRVSKTPPYSWDGNAATIEAHLGATFQRLKGHGLRSFELEALVAYVSGLPAPPTKNIEVDQKKVNRGQQIFASSEAGCSTCHSGGNFTDGINHDVGSKHAADRADKFNTPSLHLVGGTGPYFHDGRYASLPELLRKSDGKMGHTKHLSNADMDALTSYLETL